MVKGDVSKLCARCYRKAESGEMQLRDQFAKVALHVLCATAAEDLYLDRLMCGIVERAWQIADAMMKARDND